jgi:hypothetical protein
MLYVWPRQVTAQAQPFATAIDAPRTIAAIQKARLTAQILRFPPESAKRGHGIRLRRERAVHEVFMNKKPRILFFSMGDASRGQMAEGFLSTMAG